MPKLEASDAGIAVLKSLADAVSEQTTFPDLARMEDSASRIAYAKKAVADLGGYRQRQRDEAEEQRAHIQTRENGRKVREEAHSRLHNLENLHMRLDALAGHIGSQGAGYGFQDLMDYFEVDSRRPYVIDGRQIDGSVTIEGTTYLV